MIPHRGLTLDAEGRGFGQFSLNFGSDRAGRIQEGAQFGVDGIDLAAARLAPWQVRFVQGSDALKLGRAQVEFVSEPGEFGSFTAQQGARFGGASEVAARVGGQSGRDADDQNGDGTLHSWCERLRYGSISCR